uniref:Beta-microseminoprotein n=1 Tax=Denticeps clupeoides TaxID=299321 RepID=A0AAY4DI02_9TELE
GMSGTAVLLLFALFPLAHGACFNNPKAPEIKEVCQDSEDKTYHVLNTYWRNSKCMDCSCRPYGVSCCSIPADCDVEYNNRTCTFEVVKSIKPSTPCPFAVIGE